MKLHKESTVGANDVSKNTCDSSSKPKIFTVNMETGKVYTEDTEKKYDKEEILRNNNNDVTEVSSIRLLKIIKSENHACGFHLTRTKWDPYPWVSAVDADTPADISGLKVGDCVLEVNGEDVLGLRITDIAKLVRAKSEHVTLLLWSAGCDSKSDPESLCDGPMPRTLQRLSIIVQSILSIIECPVCLDTIPPPAMQCQNGHLLCVNCRIRAEKCPVCRDRYTPRRALIAEQIYTAITNAFNLCRTEDKLRQKLFGTNVKLIQQQQQQQQQQQEQQVIEQLQCEQQKSIANMVKTSANKEVYPRALENTMESLCRSRTEVCKSAAKANGNGKERIGLQLPTNKFLAKLLLSKACSVDNVSSATATETTTQTYSTNSDGPLMSCPATPSTFVVKSFKTNSPLPVTSTVLSTTTSNTKTYSADTTNQRIQSCPNQLHNMTNTRLVAPNVENCIHSVTENQKHQENQENQENQGNLDDFAPTNYAGNKITKVNGTSKHFSSSEKDFLIQKRSTEATNNQLTTTAYDGLITSTEVEPECTPNCGGSPAVQTVETPTHTLLILDKRPPRRNIAIGNYNQHNDSVES